MKKSFLSFLLLVASTLFFQTVSFAQVQLSNEEVQSITWQCKAVDSTGVSFLGDEVFGKNNAANEALANCREQSDSPESCKVVKCRSNFQCHNHACM